MSLAEGKLSFVDGHFDHLDGRLGSVAVGGRRTLDIVHDIHAVDDFAKYRMLRLSAGEPIQILVVYRVEEELAATTIGPTGIGHGEGPWLIGDLGIGGMLIFNTAVGAVAGASARTFRILAVRAAKLDHEIIDHAMEVQPIVKAALGQVDEVTRGHRHLVDVEFHGKGSH
jgi:hypothetical protein